MDEMLSVAEIEARFAPDWVLIGEPQTDDQQRLLGGRVVFHSPDRDAVYRKARELRLDRIAVRYLGSSPEDMALVFRPDTHSVADCRRNFVAVAPSRS